MTETSYIQELLEDLSRGGVDFIVAGGVALVLQGIDRATMDIDLAVDLEKSNLVRFLEVMEQHGMRPRAPVPASFILDSENLRRVVIEKHARVFTFQNPTLPFKQIDIFLTNDLAYANFHEKCDRIKIGNQMIKVLSIDQLIYTKELISPPRSKDTLDLEELKKRKGRNDAN